MPKSRRRGRRLSHIAAVTVLAWTVGGTSLFGTQATVHFPAPIATPASMTIAGVLTVDGSPPAAGAEIAVFTPAGRVCGAASVDTAEEGRFILHVYGDDDTTPGLVEGLTPGAEVTFTVFDPLGNREVQHAELTVSAGVLHFADRRSVRADVDAPSPGDGDGDGVPDSVDAFPTDSAASVDTDDDGAPDAWNPGRGSDDSTTGLSLDAFPADPGEWADTDGDGLGDNADGDDDGDGYSDAEEVAAGSDPLDPASTPSGARPARPAILSLASDPAAPLTSFHVALSPFDDPDDPGAAPSAVEWSLHSGSLECDLCQLAFRLEGEPPLLELPQGLLSAGTRVFASVRYVDSDGLRSAWSELYGVELPPRDPADLDGDGVEDRAEVPEATDLDGDGANDGEEGHTVFREPEAGGLVALTVPEGRVERLYVARRSELPEAERPPFEMPFGLYAFRLAGLEPGATVAVTYYLPSPLPDDARWYKTSASQGPQDFTAAATFEGARVRLRVTDGGVGDADGLANGVIVDPGGPALPPPDSGDSTGGGGGGCFLRTLGSGAERVTPRASPPNGSTAGTSGATIPASEAHVGPGRGSPATLRGSPEGGGRRQIGRHLVARPLLRRRGPLLEHSTRGAGAQRAPRWELYAERAAMEVYEASRKSHTKSHT